MPNFKYVALGADGKTYRGIMNAPDRSALNDRLREEGKFLTTVKEVGEKKYLRKLKTVVVADFCRQLGTLLGAGVSLVRALNIIASEENLKPREKAVYVDMLKTIRQGISLSEAMEKQSPAFPELLVNMLRSAEVSGNIDQTCKRMADHYEKEHKINSKVRSAMVYPIILAVMMVVIIIFCCAYILPQFSDLFAGMDLPLLTRIIMGLSDAIVNYWYLILIAVVLLVFAINMILKIPPIRCAFDHLKLKLPVIGKLLRTIYTARFARTLSSLYGSGVPIMSSLSTAARTVGNKYIAGQFDAAVQSLQQGGTLADAMRGIDGFEIKLASSVNIGEETGNLDEMLDVTADSYDYASEQAINRLVSLMEPVMLIVMGVMVGCIMLGVLLPIFSSYNAIADSGTTY
jgi:type IV pilus assembly protein PilC